MSHNVARAQAYLHAKFHLDLSNRLAIVHQRYGQTDRTTVRRHMANRFGRPFVKRFALCYRFIVCPVCLPVCPVCDVRALWPNGWTDQDETWHAGRPRPWPHCVRWRPISPSPKGGKPPIFGPYLLWPNGCMDQDATLIWRKDLAQATLC